MHPVAGYVTQEGCLALSETSVQFRELVLPAELDAVMRLRYEVLCVEQGYCHPFVSRPPEMMDRYDPASRHIGGFRNGGLVAAARLVSGRYGVGLPTWNQLPDGSLDSIPREHCGEVSRVAVAAGSRGAGLFTKMLALCLSLASHDRLEGVLISEKTSERYRARLRLFGFLPIFDKYTFCDERIKPAVFTTTYLAAPLASPDQYLALGGS